MHISSVRKMLTFASLFALCGLDTTLPAEDSFTLDRCELVPLPGHQLSFHVDGVEKTRWHFGREYPRPFFYPFRGPSGASLTRMGHPGAQNHDHHRSVWFAHHNVGGVNFWSDNTEGRVRQKHWYRYQDGHDEAIMASVTGWYDGQGRELMEQDIVAALMPLADGEHALEIQITLRPSPGFESIELGKTNFGFLAVRVAKTVSVYFGSGRLTNSEGQQGEKEIFGKPARWMDYSGSVAVGQGPGRRAVTEGITYFDHPTNPRYPTHWHVRADGWMGASFCMQEGWTLPAGTPLTLRYLLHAHRDAYDHAKAQSVHAAFAARPGLCVRKAHEPHRQYEVERIDGR
jgi:hypothetical protein